MSVDPLELKVGRAVLQRFREHNATRHAECQRLRGAIKAVLDACPSENLNARQICYRLDLRALGRSAYPSLRSVQWHLQSIRQKPSF